MHHVRTNFRRAIAVSGLLAIGLAAAWTVQVRGQAAGVTVFEGARVIVGDGRAPIENAAFVVTGTRITQVGTRGPESRVPAGAARVNLAGKTVMPAIIDTHNHLSQTREMLIDDLKRRAYYGVSAAQSMGQDTTDVPFQIREETREGRFPAPRASSPQGAGSRRPSPDARRRRSGSPPWPKRAKAVQDNAAKKVDIIKIWVDDRMGMVKKLSPELYSAVIDEAHKNGLRVIAHIYTLEDHKGVLRAGVDAFAHGVRDKDVDDEFVAMVKQHPNLVLGPNMPDRGVKIDLELAAREHPAGRLREARGRQHGRCEGARRSGASRRATSRR